MRVSSAISTSVMEDHIQEYKQYFRCRIHPKKMSPCVCSGVCMHVCVGMYMCVWMCVKKSVHKDPCCYLPQSFSTLCFKQNHSLRPGFARLTEL